MFVLSACSGGGGSSVGVVIPTCPATPTGANVTLSGTVQFHKVPHNSNSGLDYNATFAKAARGVTVQVINSRSNAVLSSTSTDNAGDYSLLAPDNTAVFIRVRAEMISSGSANWQFRVVDNTNSGALYVMDGSHLCTGTSAETRDLLATSGWNGSSYDAGDRIAGPYAILDTIYDGVQLVLSAQSTITFPALNINWSFNNIATLGSINIALGQLPTSFFDGTAIYLLGSENNDTDEYDSHIVAHEWGHYIEDNFSRSDSIGGVHSAGNHLDMRVAFGEGFGSAFAAMVLDDPVFRDAIGIGQSAGLSFSVEDEPVSNPGWYSEQTVEKILYDLFDSNADVAEDTLALGFSPLWDVLVAEQRTSVALTSIFGFITALKARNSGVASDIDTLVTSYSIVSSTIDAYGTTETNDDGGLATTALPIYTTITPDGTVQNLCVTDRYDRNLTAENTLGARRFLRFTIASAGNYTTTVAHDGGVSAPNTDPDIVLHQSGRLVVSQVTGATEIFVRNYSAGDYILEFYDFDLFTADISAGPITRCFDVSIAP